MASSYESTLEYIMASDEKGYHFTIFSDIKEPATAQVEIAEVTQLPPAPTSALVASPSLSR